jgi:hypothetical protein
MFFAPGKAIDRTANRRLNRVVLPVSQVIPLLTKSFHLLFAKGVWVPFCICLYHEVGGAFISSLFSVNVKFLLFDDVGEVLVCSLEGTEATPSHTIKHLGLDCAVYSDFLIVSLLVLQVLIRPIIMLIRFPCLSLMNLLPLEFHQAGYLLLSLVYDNSLFF